MPESIFSTVPLTGGVAMPMMGFAPVLFNCNTGAECDASAALYKALECGIRCFDTAPGDGTESVLGNLLQQGSVPREQLFITVKISEHAQGHDNARVAFDHSLQALQTDYADLCLIDWPLPHLGLYLDTWQALEELYHEGKAKAVGVCHFTVQQLHDILQSSDVVPAVNQIEMHPYYIPHDLLSYMHQHNIMAQSVCPFGRGQCLSDARLDCLTRKHQRSAAQILLRWHLQSGFPVVMKTSNVDHIEENARVFDFDLTPEDMAYTMTLARGQRLWRDPNKYPGALSYKHVEALLRHHAQETILQSNASTNIKRDARDAVERMLYPRDNDGMRDIVVYCFMLAVQTFGPNPNIEAQAQACAIRLGRMFATDALSGKPIP